MKVALRILIVLLYVWVCVVHGKSSYIFLFDNQETEKINEPFYVTYQLVTALYEGSTPLFISESLLAHVKERVDFYTQQLQKENSHPAQLHKIYEQIQTHLFNKKSPADINKKYGVQWFEKEYSDLAELAPHQYQQLAFHFLCYMMRDTIQKQWNMYELSHGFLLLEPTYFKKRENLKSISFEQVKFIKGKDKPFKEAVQKLKEVIDKEPVYVYASGHGTADKQPRVCGLLIKNFTWLLDELATVKTKLFVYNSCYAGDKNMVSSFEDEHQNIKQYSFPIVNIAVTHAPTYTFGYPEGFVLPPYMGFKQLQKSDIAGKKMQPRFLQHFTEFFARARAGELKVDLINPYRTCNEYKCNIVQVENIPTILYPGAQKFEILDKEVLFGQHQVCILHAQYIKQKTLQDAVVFIPFIPGCAWYEIGSLQVRSVTMQLAAWAKHALCGIEDLYAQYTLYIPELLFNQKKYKHVLFFYHPEILPQGITKDVGMYFEQSGKGYFLDVEQSSIVPVDEMQRKKIKEYIGLWKKHNHVQQDNLVQAYYQYQEQLERVKKECMHDKLCTKI